MSEPKNHVFSRFILVKKISVPFVFMSLVSSSSMAVSEIQQVAQVAHEFVHPDKKMIARLIERFGVGGEVALPDPGFMESLGLQAGWRFDVEPSYREGLISRTDEFFFSSGDIPGLSLFPASLSDAGLGAGLDSEIRCKFIKQYLDGLTATKDMTYLKNLLHITKYMPLDAERALSKMVPGDYFSMRLPMTLNMGYDQASRIFEKLPLEKNIGYSLSGLFEIHIAKLSETKVQLKLVFVNGKSSGLSVDSQYSGVLSLTPISYINKRVTKLLKLSPVQFSLSQNNDQIFMADYILDLSKPQVARAYDEVLSSVRNISKATKLASPKVTFFRKNVAKNAEKMKQNLQTSIEPLDLVVAESIAKQNENNGEFSAIRLFKGSNHVLGKNFNLHLGTKLFSFDGSSNSGQNDITSFSSTEEASYYHADSEIYGNNKAAGLDYWELSQRIQLTAVFSSDQNFENKKVAGIVISNEPKDKQFSAEDFEKTKKHLAATLPPLVYKRIRFEQWGNSNKIRHAVGYRSKLVLSPEFIRALPPLTQEQLYSKYISYVEKLEADKIYKRPVVEDNDVKQLASISFEDQVREIARALSIADNSNIDPIERLRAFVGLKKNTLFNQTGIRFVLELVPIQKLNSLIFFDLEMNSSEDDRLKFSFGSESDAPSYQKVINILEIINNQGLDIIMTAQKVASDYLHKPQGN